MAAADKTIKQEDRFIAFWKRLYVFYTQHQRHFLIGLLAAVAVAAVVLGWMTYQSRVQAKAWAEYERILVKSNQEGADQAKTRDEALKELQELIDRRPRSKAAGQARLEIAAMAAQDGDYEKAVTYYLAFLDGLKPADPVRPAVADALGHCFEALNKLDEAAQWYTIVAESRQLADLGLWNLARVNELAGEKAKAVEAYRRLTKEHPDSPYISPAYDRLVDLEG